MDYKNMKFRCVCCDKYKNSKTQRYKYWDKTKKYVVAICLDCYSAIKEFGGGTVKEYLDRKTKKQTV